MLPIPRPASAPQEREGGVTRARRDHGWERGWADDVVAAQHPELVRAGVSLYGVTDLRALAATTHRFESRYLDRIVGVLPDDGARYDDRSPITHAASIRVPLLVLHGGADKVVPPEQASSLVAAVRAGGGTVEHHVYEGEGHGWSGRATIADALTRTEEFLRRWVLST